MQIPSAVPLFLSSTLCFINATRQMTQGWKYAMTYRPPSPPPSLVTASFLPAHLQGHTMAGVDCFYRVPVTMEHILYQLGIVLAVEGSQAVCG